MAFKRLNLSEAPAAHQNHSKFLEKIERITSLDNFPGISEKEKGFQNASRCNKHFSNKKVERSMVLDVSPGGLVAWRFGFI